MYRARKKWQLLVDKTIVSMASICARDRKGQAPACVRSVSGVRNPWIARSSALKNNINNLLIVLLVIMATACREDITQPTTYRNISEEATLVGMNTCLECHAYVHETFQHTGMGRSFGEAHQARSDASFHDVKPIYEENSDFYYYPYVQDSLMYVLEYRLSEEGDTVHQRVEQLDYIVGSGHHTNSHIIAENGYIYQAPVTYYTQDQKWEMAPSYRAQGNLRFDRLLAAECITCHNHYPTQVAGSLNKFEEMPSGIECERCHGAGSIHVAEKKAGKVVDIANEIDYSIVNPRKLEREKLMDLCQRCHLQGIAVLAQNKTYFDFKPGMDLAEVMNVFLPRYGNSHENFIMASQADRLRQSKCYVSSDLTCLNCHHPHESVQQKDASHFNMACMQCHEENTTQCKASAEEKATENNNCIACHMPKSGSIDIPHIRITDHKIQVVKDIAAAVEEDKAFYGIECLTKQYPSALEMARGYIAMYDKYTPRPYVLDSAHYHLLRTKEETPLVIQTWIHYYLARENYSAILDKITGEDILAMNDAWTAYRVGEAYLKKGDNTNALLYLSQAVELQPYDLDFADKYAMALIKLKKYTAAKTKLEWILAENPKRSRTWTNLGYVYAVQRQIPKAEEHYDKALALDPDNKQALRNKAAILNIKGDIEGAKKLLKRVE